MNEYNLREFSDILPRVMLTGCIQARLCTTFLCDLDINVFIFFLCFSERGCAKLTRAFQTDRRGTAGGQSYNDFSVTACNSVSRNGFA